VKYKNEWKPNSLNKEFWGEVLVGHKITDIRFDNKGIHSFVLENGQQVIILGVEEGRLGIISDHEPALADEPAPASEFKVGDTVVLASMLESYSATTEAGSLLLFASAPPLMTVMSIAQRADDLYLCGWYHDGGFIQHWFPAALLRKVKRETAGLGKMVSKVAGSSVEVE